MDTPSYKLAERIIDRLTKEQLLAGKDGSKLLTKLASGGLRAEDWRLPIEVATSKSDDAAEGQP